MDKDICLTHALKGAPAVIQLIPFGRHETPKGIFILDKSAIKNVMEDFSTRKNQMVIDYEHQTLSGSVAPAAGWINKLLDKGAGGIWAEVEWTHRARQFLGGCEYRYLSPVFLTQREDHRVVRLVNAALTNDPAIDGMAPLVGKADAGDRGDPLKRKEEKGSLKGEKKKALMVTNGCDKTREPKALQFKGKDTGSPFNGKGGNKGEGLATSPHMGTCERAGSLLTGEGIGLPIRRKEEKMEKVLEALGLDIKMAEARESEEKALGAIGRMRSELETLGGLLDGVRSTMGLESNAGLAEIEGTLVAMKAEAGEAAELRQRVRQGEAALIELDARELVAHAMKEGKVTPAQKDWAHEYAMRDADSFRTFVAKAPSVVPVATGEYKAGLEGRVKRSGGVCQVQGHVNRALGLSDERFLRFANLTIKEVM